MKWNSFKFIVTYLCKAEMADICFHTEAADRPGVVDDVGTTKYDYITLTVCRV